jgi:hypothetical protein
MHKRVLQMKTFLDAWDQHWDHVSKKAYEDGDEAVLEAQGWYWEEPYKALDLDIDGHTESGTTMSKAKDDKEGREEGQRQSR